MSLLLIFQVVRGRAPAAHTDSALSSTDTSFTRSCSHSCLFSRFRARLLSLSLDPDLRLVFPTMTHPFLVRSNFPSRQRRSFRTFLCSLLFSRCHGWRAVLDSFASSTTATVLSSPTSSSLLSRTAARTTARATKRFRVASVCFIRFRSMCAIWSLSHIVANQPTARDSLLSCPLSM